MPPKNNSQQQQPSSLLPHRRERDNSTQPKITSFIKVQNKGNTICKYFTGAPGSCKDGGDCRYKHSEELSSAATASQKQQENNNGNNDNQQMMMMMMMPSSEPSKPKNQSQNSVASASASVSASVNTTTKNRLVPECNGNSSSSSSSSCPKVPLPWDENNTFKCKYTKEVRSVWKVVEQYMTLDQDTKIQTIRGFVSLMVNVTSICLSKQREPSSFSSLVKAIRTMPDANFESNFYSRILPKMMKYTLLGPRAFPSGLPLLSQNCPASDAKLVLTQLQVSILMCIGFFGLYPYQRYHQRRAPGCNLTPLYNSASKTSVEKIKCILAYFDTVTDPSVAPDRERGRPCYFDIEYIRVSIQNERDIKNEMMVSSEELTELAVNDDGVIETHAGELQADFANKTIGGGVLNHGCVQEEIRFVISPELLISRVFVEDLLDNEAIIMSGTHRYSQYIGYGGGFQFAGRIFPLPQPTEQEIKNKMFDISVVAFDAIDFSYSQTISPEAQYRQDWVFRELVKAYVAFRPVSISSSNSAKSSDSWIATGNWGCGVFAGDLELKLIIQMIAAAFNHRPVHYFTFSNPEFMSMSEWIYEVMTKNKVTIGQLLNYVLMFSDLHEKAQDERQRRLEEGIDDHDNTQTEDDDDNTQDFEVSQDPDGDVIIINNTAERENKKRLNQILNPPKSLFKFIADQIKNKN